MNGSKWIWLSINVWHILINELLIRRVSSYISSLGVVLYRPSDTFTVIRYAGPILFNGLPTIPIPNTRPPQNVVRNKTWLWNLEGPQFPRTLQKILLKLSTSTKQTISHPFLISKIFSFHFIIAKSPFSM